jgi:hypothetical protein
MTTPITDKAQQDAEAERARKRIRDGVIDALKRNHDNRKGKRRGRR